MLSARHRFRSRGSMTAGAAGGGRIEATMVTVPPAAIAGEPPSHLQGGQYAPGALPIQDLIGTGVRELFTSMLNAATAVRLGGNSAKPRYFGTVTPNPQVWRTPSDVNDPEEVRAGVINAGNAPQFSNKNASAGTPPRIARSLPTRPR
jgi:hypothetical protein